MNKHTPGPLKAVQIIIENSPCTWAVQRKSIREQWARDYNKLTDALAQAEGRDK